MAKPSVPTLILAVALLATPIATALLQRHAPLAAPAAPTAAHLDPLHAMAKRFPPPPLPGLPTNLEPAGRADAVLHQQAVAGRTPGAWLDLAHHDLTLDAARSVSPSPQDLPTAIAALYAAVGVAPSPADRAAAADAASSVPEAWRGPLGGLVAETAGAYAAQLPIAHAVAARAPSFRPDSPLMLLPQERDATIVHTGGLLAAIARSVGEPDASLPSAALCLAPVAPDCLAWLGGCGDDTYEQTAGPFPDPVLLVEPCGDDTYHNSAGGANPAGVLIPGPNPAGGNGLALSVVADLAGDDTYDWTGAPSVVQGSGSGGGLGVLVDAAGNDLYLADFTRSNVGPPLLQGVGLGYLDGGAQGTGYAGVGVQIDALGDDVYDLHIASTQGRCIWGFAQGFGGAGGLGVSSDLSGNDDWLSRGTGLTGGNDCWGVGSSNDAFQGLYPQGVGIYAGVGIMTDSGLGNDDYLDYNNATTTDYYAQGFGAFGGLGILFEDGGNDRYVAYEKATATWIDPTLNCAYGTGSLGGVGIMLELGGDDSYLVDTVSNKGAETMMEGDGEPIPGYGLFIDADGVDHHEGKSTAGAGFPSDIFGRGVLDTGHNLAGTYLDLGSDDDAYIPVITGVGGSADDDSQWIFGLDR